MQVSALELEQGLGRASVHVSVQGSVLELEQGSVWVLVSV